MILGHPHFRFLIPNFQTCENQSVAAGISLRRNIWRFPKIGTPSHIIHFNGIFHEINHHSWGTPMTSWKPPVWGMELPNLLIGHCFNRQRLHVHSGSALDAEPCPTSRQVTHAVFKWCCSLRQNTFPPEFFVEAYERRIKSQQNLFATSWFLNSVESS